MNPALKKKLIERGLQKTQPRQWQDTGWQAEKCPKCNHALHTKEDVFICDHCGLSFKRNGWKLDIIDPTVN